MSEHISHLAVSIRPATTDDAPRIVRAYLESAEEHARLDPERYFVPDAETVIARYGEGRQHAAAGGGDSITLVAEWGAEIVGFVDAHLGRSPDAMHHDVLYCHIVEIAVSVAYRGRSIGEQLMHAAEAWGRAQGATFASLEYVANNTRAADFYQRRLGYRAAAATVIKKL